MSGAAGGTRIPRSAVEQTVKDYTDNILSKIEGFKDAKLSGSYNRPEKEDFGDIDIIVTIETDKSKKEIKKIISDLFQSLSDQELPPLQNPKYKGRKYINHGEMVSNLYPISGIPGEFVQIDNIISLSQEEGEFKKTILDYPAEIQGLVLGLVKTPLLEEKPEEVFKRLNITDIPEAGEDQEYEFHIDTSGLTLRLVTYGDNYRILNSNIVWQSRNFEDVKKLLKDYNLNGTFEDIIETIKSLKNERSKNRLKGYFKKSIKVGAAEKGTPKGDIKQKALDTVAQLQESSRVNTRNNLKVQYLEEEEKPKVAIFPGAFKPPHKDHVSRINAASEKVGDEGKVIVLISPSSRAKEGQEEINAEQSLRVFNILKEKGIIPKNVNFTIAPDKSPVLSAYKEFESNLQQPYIAVFGKDDKARFSNIEDKLPNVTVSSFESANIGNTSATDLRIALANRDKGEIEKYIPTGITVDEYLDALTLSENIQEDTDSAADLWEPHAEMLDRMQKQPELLKGLWKSLSKPSRRALVLYFRRKKTQTEDPVLNNESLNANQLATLEINGDKVYQFLIKVFGEKSTDINFRTVADQAFNFKGNIPLDYFIIAYAKLDHYFGEPEDKRLLGTPMLKVILRKIGKVPEDVIETAVDYFEYQQDVLNNEEWFEQGEFDGEEDYNPITGSEFDDMQDNYKDVVDYTVKNSNYLLKRQDRIAKENVIPKKDETAAPYGSGYKLVTEKIVKVGNDYVVYPSKGGKRLGTHPTYKKALAQLRAIEASKNMEESLWANINAKKKAGKKSSHKNSNAYKDAKKAGDALKKSKAVKEAQGQKKLRVFDFDDTLVHVDATIYITHKDGSKEGLTPAEYAVYTPQEGDTFNFSEFSSVIKKAKPLEDNIQDLIKSYNDPTEKTTILTARLLGFPVKKYLKDEFGIEPYVVGLGSSDPQEKARWIENQINKGYNDIEFRDDSKKNVDAVADLEDKYPDVKLTSILVTENVNFVALEKVLDDMFDDLDIDINFTKHFKERVIERGLTEEDIIELMRKIHYYHGEEVSDLAKGENRVFTHLKRLVDVAAINTGYGDDYLKDLVLKTAYKRSHKSEPVFKTNRSSPKLVVRENATYSKDIDIKYKIAELTQHMLDKGMNIKPLPAVEFVNGDSENAKDFFGKTAYYNPATNTIVLYTEGRHPKDIVRSFAHEMIHHIQNLEGRLDDIDTTNTHESDYLNDIEKEANLNGTMTFRNWTDSLQEKKKVKDPFGVNAYALELARGLEEVIMSEGVYDSITAQISSDIFNAWKEQFNQDETRDKASFTKSYDLLDKKGRPVVFDLDADLNFIETEDSIYRPDGDADEGEEEKYDDEGNLEDPGLQGSISLYFQVDPRTLPKMWSTISMDIKDIIRHEVEHLSQAGYNVVPAKELPDDRMLRSYIQDLGLMPASNYYLLDKEVPAMLQGMYYKAKKMKKPFKDVVNSYLDIFVNNETIDNQEKEDILKRWRVAAKELNLPSL